MLFEWTMSRVAFGRVGRCNITGKEPLLLFNRLLQEQAKRPQPFLNTLIIPIKLPQNQCKSVLVNTKIRT